MSPRRPRHVAIGQWVLGVKVIVVNFLSSRPLQVYRRTGVCVFVCACVWWARPAMHVVFGVMQCTARVGWQAIMLTHERYFDLSLNSTCSIPRFALHFSSSFCQTGFPMIFLFSSPFSLSGSILKNIYVNVYVGKNNTA